MFFTGTSIVPKLKTGLASLKTRIVKMARIATYFLKKATSRNSMAHASFLVGIAAIGYGASLYSHAQGWIAGGIGLVVYGYLLGRE